MTSVGVRTTRNSLELTAFLRPSWRKEVLPMPYLAPQTMTREEQEDLLRASHGHPRDHLILSLALGTGLRLAEIVGLNVGDIYFPDGAPRSRIRLRRETVKGGRSADVFLPDALVPKLERFWGYKLRAAERVNPIDPIFCNQSGQRISKRRVQLIFRRWQLLAGFDRLYSFHCLRHSAVTNVYRASRDLFLAQRFARHVSPLTTTIYTHPSDEELSSRLRSLSC